MELQHTETLLHYDEPIVFVGRDADGLRYLAMAVADGDGKERYLAVPAPMGELRRLRAASVDMRTLLLKAGRAAWFLADATAGTAKPMPFERQSAPLEQSGLLPDDGFFLAPA